MGKKEEKVDYEQKLDRLGGLQLEPEEGQSPARKPARSPRRKFDLTEEIVHRIIARIKKV